MATEDEYWDLWEAVKEDDIDVVRGTSLCSIFFCRIFLAEDDKCLRFLIVLFLLSFIGGKSSPGEEH